MSSRYTKEELRQAVDALVKRGELVRVEQIDPTTGKLSLRYFHRDHAPKWN